MAFISGYYLDRRDWAALRQPIARPGIVPASPTLRDPPPAASTFVRESFRRPGVPLYARHFRPGSRRARDLVDNRGCREDAPGGGERDFVEAATRKIARVINSPSEG